MSAQARASSAKHSGSNNTRSTSLGSEGTCLPNWGERSSTGKFHPSKWRELSKKDQQAALEPEAGENDKP